MSDNTESGSYRNYENDLIFKKFIQLPIFLNAQMLQSAELEKRVFFIFL